VKLDSGIRSAFLTSTPLRDIVLVAVTARNPAS